MSHAQAAIASGSAPRHARSRPAAVATAAAPGEDRLRPARGLVLGLGLSSLIWTALIALIAL